MKWILIFAYLLPNGTMESKVARDYAFTSYQDCQKVQVQVVEENRDAVMKGTFLPLCINK